MTLQIQQTTYIAPGEGEAFLVGNSLGARTKVRSDATVSRVAILEHTLPPGFLGAPFHKHDNEDEISYVLDGEMTVQQDREIIVAGPGAFVLKPRGVFHTFWNGGHRICDFWKLSLPAALPVISANCPRWCLKMALQTSDVCWHLVSVMV